MRCSVSGKNNQCPPQQEQPDDKVMEVLMKSAREMDQDGNADKALEGLFCDL